MLRKLLKIDPDLQIVLELTLVNSPSRKLIEKTFISMELS